MSATEAGEEEKEPPSKKGKFKESPVYRRRELTNACFSLLPDGSDEEDDDTLPPTAAHYWEEKAKREQKTKENKEVTTLTIIKALQIRQRYATMANQSFPQLLTCLLKKYAEEGFISMECISTLLNDSNQKHDKTPDVPPSGLQDAGDDPFTMEIPRDFGVRFQMNDGVMHVYSDTASFEVGIPTDWPYPDLATFLSDQSILSTLINDGPIHLQTAFEAHVSDKGTEETRVQKKVPLLDFNSVRKVDTHIHAASCMSQTHLLRFIKKTMKTKANDIVCIATDGKEMTLSEVFQSIPLSAEHLTIDTLNVHAGKSTFENFDEFENNFNPFGNSRLREIFMKTENYIGGQYFASILKEVLYDLEESKYQSAEYRLSIYGRSADEWDRLAVWWMKNRVYSKNVRWLVQTPRLYVKHKQNGHVKNFQQMLDNLFLPLFEATANPESHPELHRFLSQVSGFDTVGDESKVDDVMIDKDAPLPGNWSEDENPSYSYYCYYTFTNLVVLNHLRRERGFNQFVFRPHCGEAGPIHHMITGFMISESISHGLLLRKSPVLEYLYYVTQIGIAMSPLSNNYLYCNYNENPLPEFHALGLRVSLSTDDPLQFHLTKEPLIEEYSMAAHMWKLNSVDTCELARNSVLMSGFPHQTKQHWLGPNFARDGPAGNDVNRSNVPDIRVDFRYEALIKELFNIFQSVSSQPN